jgi:predicted transcriptional regulator
MPIFLVLIWDFMEGQYLHKRNKFQIYYDVLSGINLETNNGEGAKPTRVQVHSNLAYDKLARYLKELEMNEMILQNPLRITAKGREFLQDHDCAKNGLRVSGYFCFASLIFIMFNLSLC